jgi:hemerythrin
MKWTEDYATGSKEVDEQHKMLFHMSDQFRDTLEGGFGEKTYDLFIDFLSNYAKAHFSYEEDCMLAHLCPVADQNKKEHCGFSALVDAEAKRFHRDGFNRQMAFALVGAIDRWLDSHIRRVDVQLRSVLP